MKELVVLSHLRWTFVWQRPQHLISRLAVPDATWFVEEPLAGERARVCIEQHAAVRRAWLEIGDAEGHVGFDHAAAAGYGRALEALLGRSEERTVWLYTPLALPLAREIGYDLLVYDVMDDLAAFRFASDTMRTLQDEALAEADVVFTGGRSLFEGVRDRAPGKAFLFPSGVESAHYAPAHDLRSARRRERPVAGYVGVLDERLDLELIAGLAAALPGWDLEIVGPLAKISEDDLPQAPNIRYPGMRTYEELPAVMAGFDVALMPFALNEATRSISPTKTLEYLAAGLPVVSTRVPDVVAGYAGVVDLEDDADGFARACRRALDDPVPDRAAAAAERLHAGEWDTIAARMRGILGRARAGLPLLPDNHEAAADAVVS